MDTVLAQAVINGLLLGGVYTAYSAGFSLIFGVMGVVNLAHGELIMLGAFTSYWLFDFFKLDPYLSAPFAMVFLFIFGYLVQKHIINRVIGQPHIMSYILTFGLHLMVANIAIKMWTQDFRNHYYKLFRSQRRHTRSEYSLRQIDHICCSSSGYMGFVVFPDEDRDWQSY